MTITRRTLSSGLISGAALPLALQPDAPAAQSSPPYTLSINVDYLFPARMSKPDRVQRVADLGFSAYSYVAATEAEQDAMLRALSLFS